MEEQLHFACVNSIYVKKLLKTLFKNNYELNWKLIPKQYEVTVVLNAYDTEPYRNELIKKLDKYYYASNTNDNLCQYVVKFLIRNKKTVTAAESLTAGAFQSTVADVSGASSIFPGGFVTYSKEAKHKLLDIPMDIMNDYGIVSKCTAIYMAKRSLEIMNTDFGLGFTGVAGPEGLENKPVGTVWIGISDRNKKSLAFSYHFTGDRQEIRYKSVLQGFLILINKIKGLI